MKKPTKRLSRRKARPSLHKTGEVKNLHLPLEVMEANLDEHTLGVFVKILSWGRKMTVRGLFVNGHAMGLNDLAVVCPNSTLIELEQSVVTLITARLVERMGDVLCIPNPTVYYGAKTYSQSVLTKVVGVVRQTETAITAEAVSKYIQSCGVLKLVSNDALRNEILALYAQFGEDKNAVQSYIGLFRSAKQIQDGARMSLPRHLRAVKSFYDMYLTKQYTIGVTQGEISREHLLGAICCVCERKLTGLNNHNYIKTMFKNGYEPNKQIGPKVSGKTDEGYSRTGTTD